jgi:hypothetical protein
MLKNLNLKVLAAGSVIALTSIVASCKKDIVRAPGTDNIPSKLNTRSAGDNIYDLLGFGYDATGEYGSSNSATYQVIDINKLVQNEPGRYVPDVNVTQYAEYAAGGNASDYLHSLTSNTTATLAPLGLSSFWGATLTVNFHETSKVSSKYSYASASVIIKQKRIKFNAPIDLIKSTYLTSVFKSDVSTMSAQQLVTKYGTHVLTDIVLGAKLNIFYRSQSSSSNKGQSVKAGLDVHGLFHTFGIKSDVTYADSSVNSNYDQTMYYSTVGGDGTKGVFGQLSLDNTSPKVDITAWQSSCTRDNAAFIQISNVAGSTIPLQDLIDDAAKKQAVANYIAQYVAGKQTIISTDPIYQFYSGPGSDHFTSGDPNATNGFANWRSDGVDFKAYLGQAPGTVPVYLFYNGPDGDHFSTTDRGATNGYANWQYYGIEFYAYKTQVAGTIPVYLYYSRSDHFTTANPNIASQFPGWTKYGVAFYAYPANYTN